MIHASNVRVEAFQTVDLNVLDVPWRISCSDDVSYALVCGNFRELICSHTQPVIANTICVERGIATRWSLRCDRREPLSIADPYELLYGLEKTITIETQLCRPDLFFLHAAALALNESAVLFIAQSGSGKSTTAWALTNRGFGYMSDELAPIDLAMLQVQPYPHALCLKRPAPPPFEVPPSTLSTAHTLHVPADCISSVVRIPLPVCAIFFNTYESGSSPAVVPVSHGEAASLIYRNGLNQLAHHQAGLAGAARIASATAAFRLTTNDLERTCSLVRETLLSIGAG
jgi:hypothetical protein